MRHNKMNLVIEVLSSVPMVQVDLVIIGTMVEEQPIGSMLPVR